MKTVFGTMTIVCFLFLLASPLWLIVFMFWWKARAVYIPWIFLVLTMVNAIGYRYLKNKEIKNLEKSMSPEMLAAEQNREGSKQKMLKIFGRMARVFFICWITLPLLLACIAVTEGGQAIQERILPMQSICFWWMIGSIIGKFFLKRLYVKQLEKRVALQDHLVQESSVEQTTKTRKNNLPKILWGMSVIFFVWSLNIPLLWGILSLKGNIRGEWIARYGALLLFCLSAWSLLVALFSWIYEKKKTPLVWRGGGLLMCATFYLVWGEWGLFDMWGTQSVRYRVFSQILFICVLLAAVLAINLPNTPWRKRLLPALLALLVWGFVLVMTLSQLE